MSRSLTSIASCSYSRCLLCAQILPKRRYLYPPSTSNISMGWILRSLSKTSKQTKTKNNILPVMYFKSSLVVVSTDCSPQLCHSQRCWCNPGSPLPAKISMLTLAEHVKGCFNLRKCWQQLQSDNSGHFEQPQILFVSSEAV